jgi:hypothetical protein
LANAPGALSFRGYGPNASQVRAFVSTLRHFDARLLDELKAIELGLRVKEGEPLARSPSLAETWLVAVHEVHARLGPRAAPPALRCTERAIRRGRALMAGREGSWVASLAVAAIALKPCIDRATFDRLYGPILPLIPPDVLGEEPRFPHLPARFPVSATTVHLTLSATTELAAST